MLYSEESGGWFDFDKYIRIKCMSCGKVVRCGIKIERFTVADRPNCKRRTVWADARDAYGKQLLA